VYSKGSKPSRRVGATATAAQHEEGRVGISARLRKSPKKQHAGTEIVPSPKLTPPKTAKADVWKLFVEQFAGDSIVVQHRALYQDEKWMCRTGHVYWVQMPSAGLGWGFSELDHKTWDKPVGGWKAWDPTHISQIWKLGYQRRIWVPTPERPVRC
jgi:hypothetical protein